MTDVEIYKLAGWLGDTKTMFDLFERKLTPDLDYHLFMEDLCSSYFGGMPYFNDIGYHVEEILGCSLSWLI